MTTHAGTDGIVKIGATAIAEVISWTLEETLEITDASVLGTSGNRVKQASFKDWKGTLECFYDPDDTGGQAAIESAVAGSTTIALDLNPYGETSGDTHFTGNAFISSISRSGGFEGLVKATISFEGSGALTQAAIV